MRVGLCGAYVAVLMLLGPGFSSAQELTEEQAVRQFNERNPEVRALRHRVAEQSLRNRVRTLMANPMLWYTQESAADVRDDFVMVRQALPLSGRRGVYQTANREAAAATAATVEYELHLRHADVRSTFASLVRAQHRRDALAAALDEIDETVRVLRAREREGEGSRFDRLRGEREYEELRATLAAETIAVAQAQSRLAGLIGMSGSAEALVAVSSTAPDGALPPVEELVNRAMDSRHDLRAGASRLASATAEAEAGRRHRIPEPSIVGGVKRTTVAGLTGTGYVFGVELSLPVSNRGQAASAQYSATADRVSADQQALRLRIEREVRGAYRTVTLTRQQARAYVEGAASSGEEIARIARVAYQEGEQGILELVDAHRVAVAARLRGIDLMDRARQAEIALSGVVGSEVLP